MKKKKWPKTKPQFDPKNPTCPGCGTSLVGQVTRAVRMEQHKGTAFVTTCPGCDAGVNWFVLDAFDPNEPYVVSIEHQGK